MTTVTSLRQLATIKQVKDVITKNGGKGDPMLLHQNMRRGRRADESQEVVGEEPVKEGEEVVVSEEETVDLNAH